MKCLVLSILFMLLAIIPTSARVGETLDECVQRYGPMIERRPARVPESDPEVMVFSKAGITVAAEFRQGRAWQLTFRKVPLSNLEVEAILMANSGSSIWSLPVKTRDKEYRMTEDKTRLAVINWDRKGLAGSLVIMSREFATANYASAGKRVEPSATATGGKTRINPLPGF